MKELGRWRGEIIDANTDIKTLLEIIEHLSYSCDDYKDKLNEMVNLTA